jgi:signal transduction histidine kinase
MSKSLKLWQKALILVSVPLAFELIFLSCLSLLLDRAENDAREAARRKDFISCVDSTRQKTINAVMMILLYKTSPTQRNGMRAEALLRDISSDADKLEHLAVPGQEFDAVKQAQPSIAKFVGFGHMFTTAIGTHREPDLFLNPALASMEFQHDSQELQAALTKIEECEHLSSETSLSEQQSRGVVKLWLGFGVAMSTIIAIGLMVFFNHGTAKRLSIIMDNLLRYSAGKTLNPPLVGTDELSRIDETLHQMVAALEESKSKREEAEKAKQEFQSVIAHELRSPLTALAGMLALLRKGVYGTLPEKAEQRVQQSSLSVQRLVNLVSELLDMSKIESAKLQLAIKRTALSGILSSARDAMHDLAATEGIRIDVTATTVEVYADRDRIIQVLINFLSNAIKHSPQGATVYMQITQEDGFVRIGVADEGSGLQPGAEKVLFEKYVQMPARDGVARPGTGLGLAIAKEIVEGHGGQIGAANRESGGCLFYLTLPTVHTEPMRDEK